MLFFSLFGLVYAAMWISMFCLVHICFVALHVGSWVNTKSKDTSRCDVMQ